MRDDFGWGSENGYRKIPCLEFQELVQLIVCTDSDIEKYGAAAQILEHHTEELLTFCQRVFRKKEQLNQYKDFFRILQLDKPINRSSVSGKTCSQIFEEFECWKEIADMVGKII